MAEKSDDTGSAGAGDEAAGRSVTEDGADQRLEGSGASGCQLVATASRHRLVIIRAAKEGRYRDSGAWTAGSVAVDEVTSLTDMNLLLYARVANEIKHGAESRDDRRSNGPP